MKYLVFCLCLFTVIAVSSYVIDAQSTTPPQPTTQPNDIQTDGCCPGPCEDLTGRYHLRGRTKKFFGRVA